MQVRSCGMVSIHLSASADDVPCRCCCCCFLCKHARRKKHRTPCAGITSNIGRQGTPSARPLAGRPPTCNSIAPPYLQGAAVQSKGSAELPPPAVIRLGGEVPGDLLLVVLGSRAALMVLIMGFVGDDAGPFSTFEMGG